MYGNALISSFKSHPHWISWSCLHYNQFPTLQHLLSSESTKAGREGVWQGDHTMSLPHVTSPPVNRVLDVSSQAATRSLKPPIILQQGCGIGTGRRVLLSLLLSTAAIPEDSEMKKSLLEGYLKRSKENKAKNDKERLDNYYKRNYKDYFELIEGSADGKKEDQLTETEKAIRDWLQKNR